MLHVTFVVTFLTPPRREGARSVKLSAIRVALFDTMYRSVGTGRWQRRYDRALAPVTSRALNALLVAG